MDLFTCKTNLDQKVQSGPTGILLSPESVWIVFMSALMEDPIEGEKCEEIGFGMSLYQSTEAEYLQIYFGRLIDAEKDQKWKTAEINFYYYYHITSEQRDWLENNPKCDTETAFCLSESQEQILKKKKNVFQFVEQKASVWDLVRGLDFTENSEYQFWMW